MAVAPEHSATVTLQTDLAPMLTCTTLSIVSLQNILTSWAKVALNNARRMVLAEQAL